MLSKSISPGMGYAYTNCKTRSISLPFLILTSFFDDVQSSHFQRSIHYQSKVVLYLNQPCLYRTQWTARPCYSFNKPVTIVVISVSHCAQIQKISCALVKYLSRLITNATELDAWPQDRAESATSLQCTRIWSKTAIQVVLYNNTCKLCLSAAMQCCCCT